MQPAHRVSLGLPEELVGSPDPFETEARMAEQVDLQRRIDRGRRAGWISWISVIGLFVSVVGFVPTFLLARQAGSPSVMPYVFAASALAFGWAWIMGAIGHRQFCPRIVPYFAREVAPAGGATMDAFRGGRGLYREIIGLDRWSVALGVEPLSSFGFTDDYYRQEVRWHTASEGLRTVWALQRALDSDPDLEGVVADLAALERALSMAAERGVPFSLVLRLRARDSLPMVATREIRQGSLW
jgi:hypothetical protein